MKQIGLSLVMFLLVCSSTAGTDRVGTNLWIRSFDLQDQFNNPLRIVFPRTNLLVLTVADHKGSEQVEAWVRPLKARYPEGLSIEGIADVSDVPGMLRPLVRREFKKKFDHPVMLDWTGKIVKPLNCEPNFVNVFAVATNGEVVARFKGPMDTNCFARLVAILERDLLKAVLSPSSPPREARVGRSTDPVEREAP